MKEAHESGEHILEKGFEKGVFTDQRAKDKNQRLLDSAKKTAATDEASLARSEQEAKAAPADLVELQRHIVRVPAPTDAVGS